MEVIECTQNKLVLRQQRHILKVLGLGFIVLAFVTTICTGALVYDSSLFLAITLLWFSCLVTPGIFFLFKWMFRSTCIFDKLDGVFIRRYLTGFRPKTIQHRLEDVQNVAVIVPTEFDGEPVKKLTLLLVSGKQVELADSMWTAPIELGANAILISQFLGLETQSQDLVMASLGKPLDKEVTLP